MNVPNSIWGTVSTVNVLINGVQTLVAKNDEGAGSKEFTHEFTATATRTTIAFVNGNQSGDNSNLLDDVILN